MPRKIALQRGGSNNTYNFLFIIIIIAIAYLFYIIYTNNTVIISQPSYRTFSLEINQSDCNSKFNNLCNPPLKENEYVNNMIDVKQNYSNSVPINIETRGPKSNYQQVGILTMDKNGDNLILPLMGRISNNSRDKWNFYTVSNTGHLNSKLPISHNGKGCTGEYGCDDIYNGDDVYVEGYNGQFKVTKYENDTLRYLPSI